MKENRYHIDESKLSGDMVNEPAAVYRDASIAEPTMHQSAIDCDESLEDLSMSRKNKEKVNIEG